MELLGLSVAFCLAGASLGALLGAVCRTSRQAGSLGLALAMVLAVFGGCWYPSAFFPASLRSVTRMDPAGWAMDGFLAVLSPSAGTGPALRSTALLLAFGAGGLPPGRGRIPRAPRIGRLTWYTAAMPPADCPPAVQTTPKDRRGTLHDPALGGISHGRGRGRGGAAGDPLRPALLVDRRAPGGVRGVLAVVFHTEHFSGKEQSSSSAALAASAVGIAIMAVGATPIYGAILFFVICTIVGMRLPLGSGVAWVVCATVALLICLLLAETSTGCPRC